MSEDEFDIKPGDIHEIKRVVLDAKLFLGDWMVFKDTVYVRPEREGAMRKLFPGDGTEFVRDDGGLMRAMAEAHGRVINVPEQP